MQHFKLIIVMVLTLACLWGCASDQPGTTEPAAVDITVNNSFVIVVPKDAVDTTRQAANCLQTTFDEKMRLQELKIVTADPGEKAIVLTEDDTLEKGSYAFKAQGTSLYITASDPHTLLYAVKQLRQAMLDADSTTITADLCQQLSSSVDYGNLPFTFVSQNILFKNIEGGNFVDERAPRFQKLILEYQPDVLALQENSADWVYYCKSYFSKTYLIVDDFSCNVLLRKDRFEVVKDGHFWMSPTPNIKSQFEGDSGPRFCCWVLVKDKLTQREFFISNCHPDWNNDTQRALQVDVLIEQMTPYYEQYPSIACGDFNSEPDGPIYARMTEILQDSYKTNTRNLSDIDFTCHMFGESMKFIDYIFHNEGLKPGPYRILSDMYGGYVSDHYGIMTEFTFAE